MSKYSVKTGRFTFDTVSKKVRVSKDKGELSIFVNSDGEIHLNWINLDTHVQEINIMVFPFDAVFQKIHSQNNTYVLRFQSNDDKYFFYLQEKINPEEFVKNINEKIATLAGENQSMDVEEPKEVAQKMDIQQKPQVEKPQHFGNQGGNINNDFIKRIQANLMAAKGNQGHGITHLSKIITPESINAFLSETSQEEKAEFLQHLPKEQRDVSNLASNIRSPQFQQAVDVLSDALNSENAIPLFMELGLDQKHLKNYYGVHAFLKALEEWGAKQQKKE